MLYKGELITSLITIGYIVGLMISMYIEYCLWAQVVVLGIYCIYWTVWDRFMQVMYLGRAPRTKETLPDFREKCWVIQYSRVFRGLTGSQRTPGFWGVTHSYSIYPILCAFVYFLYFSSCLYTYFHIKLYYTSCSCNCLYFHRIAMICFSYHVIYFIHIISF